MPSQPLFTSRENVFVYHYIEEPLRHRLFLVLSLHPHIECDLCDMKKLLDGLIVFVLLEDKSSFTADSQSQISARTLFWMLQHQGFRSMPKVITRVGAPVIRS